LEVENLRDRRSSCRFVLLRQKSSAGFSNKRRASRMDGEELGSTLTKYRSLISGAVNPQENIEDTDLGQ